MLTTLDRVHHGRLTKVERYNWQIIDQPGTFMMISKDDLLIDNSYQRDADGGEAKIRGIAAKWSWAAFGALGVGMRQDGFYVYDGMHRLFAAKRRTDIQMLPCMVFETTDGVQEAKQFLITNTHRRPMTAVQRFKAEVISGNSVAAAAEKLIASAGRSIGRYSGPGTVTCVGAVMRLLTEDEPTLRRIWTLVVRLCDGHALHSEMLDALFYIERRLGDGQSLAVDPWSKRLTSVGRDGLLQAMQAARAYHGKGGPKIDAMGVAKALNARARTALLTLPEN
jgi:hypothetical protein